MLKKYAIFPGSFKLPHIDHYTLVKKILPKVDELYIVISPKSKFIKGPNKSMSEINADESLKIWKIYIQSLRQEKENQTYQQKKKTRDKIHLIVADRSPIMTAYQIVQKKLSSDEWKSDDTLYLIKSSKNAENSRFVFFKRLNIFLIHKTLPKFKTISSTNMRKSIVNNDYSSFEKFLPKHLRSLEKKIIWNLVKKR